MTSEMPFGGIYDAPTAARYLMAGRMSEEAYPVKSRTLIRWIRSGVSTRSLASVHGRELIFDFEDLVSLRVLAALRSYGVSWPKIAVAEDWLRRETGYERPFAREEMWTSQSEVLARFGGRIIAASRHGQYAMEMMLQYLIPINGLRFVNRVADQWEPRPLIVLDPEVQFGEPCIKGTRIPVRSVWGMSRAGDPDALVMRAYGLSDSELSAALEWGDSVATAAA